jgi:hypothetical protein
VIAIQAWCCCTTILAQEKELASIRDAPVVLHQLKHLRHHAFVFEQSMVQGPVGELRRRQVYDPYTDYTRKEMGTNRQHFTGASI